LSVEVESLPKFSRKFVRLDLYGLLYPLNGEVKTISKLPNSCNSGSTEVEH